MEIQYWIQFFFLSLAIIGVKANIPHSSDHNETAIFKGNGSLVIPLEVGLSMHSYEFKADEKSSIFGFTVSCYTNTTALHNASVKVVVNFQNLEKGIYTTDKSWTLYPTNDTKYYYFSRRSHSRVTFSPQGTSWSESEIHLTYYEIPFATLYESSSINGSTVTPWNLVEGRLYRPNCVYVYRITAERDMNVSNVVVVLNDLDIDVDVGEYLLIGAGLSPFEGPPPLFISNFMEAKQYLINEENAYVVFVTGSTRERHTGFNITWHFSGTKLTKEKEKGNEDVLESVPICIYNTTAAVEELKKSHNRFEDFREKFALIASEYAKTKKENALIPETEKISPSSVSVFRVSGIITINETNKAFYAMVKISKETDDGKAAFKWYELETIVDRYTERYADDEEDIFQFGKCPSGIIPERWGKILSLYLMIPVALCFLILIFTWRLNPVMEFFVKRKRVRQASQQINNKQFYEDGGAPETRAPENPYTQLPKVELTDIYGRRQTLNLSNALFDGDDASDEELFNRLEAQKRFNLLDSRSFRSSVTRFLSKQPEINQAFTMEDESSNQVCLTNLSEERSEHMYDTVRSTGILEETRL